MSGLQLVRAQASVSALSCCIAFVVCALRLACFECDLFVQQYDSFYRRLATLHERRLRERSFGDKWAEIGALASLSEGSDPLHCICRLRLFLEQTTEGVQKSCR